MRLIEGIQMKFSALFSLLELLKWVRFIYHAHIFLKGKVLLLMTIDRNHSAQKQVSSIGINNLFLKKYDAFNKRFH